MARKDILVAVGASLVSAGIASGVTWYVTKRIVGEQYEERLNKEIQESVDYILKNHNVVVTDDDPDILAAALDQAESELETIEEQLDEIEGERVFASEEGKPSLEELAARNQKMAYHKILTNEEYTDAVEEVFPENPEPVEEDPDISVISRDIFIENGTEWDQDTLTYFADGGVLDSMGDFVEDHEKLIGPGRPRFGELSSDANVVYVRNRRIEKEYEIISDPGNASDFLAHSLTNMYRPSWQQ